MSPRLWQQVAALRGKGSRFGYNFIIFTPLRLLGRNSPDLPGICVPAQSRKFSQIARYENNTWYCLCGRRARFLNRGNNGSKRDLECILVYYPSNDYIYVLTSFFVRLGMPKDRKALRLPPLAKRRERSAKMGEFLPIYISEATRRL
jgi:hypothetical protein